MFLEFFIKSYFFYISLKICKGLSKFHLILLHKVRNHKGWTLNILRYTLDIPVVQLTRILPLRRLFSTS